MNIFSMPREEVNTRYNEIVYSVLIGDELTEAMCVEMDMYTEALRRLDFIDALYNVTLDIAHYRDRLDTIHSG